MQKICIIILFFICLNGCAQNYQKVADERNHLVQLAVQQIDASFADCNKRIQQNINLTPLNGLILSPDNNRSLAMLNNDTYLDEAKRPALEELDREHELCRKNMIDTLLRHPTMPVELKTALLSLYDSGKIDKSELWAKKITISTYLRRRDAAYKKMNDDYAFAAKNADEQFNTAMKNAQARDHADALAAQQIYQSQQRLNLQQQQIQQQQIQNSYAPLRNKTTHCNSYILGNQLNTDCQ